MANVIKPKRSNTAAKVPTTSDLASGEMGVNMADKKVYINNGTSVVQVGAGNISGLGDVTLTSPASGEALKYDGSKWVNGSITASSTAPTIQEFLFSPLTGTFARAATKSGTYSQNGTSGLVTVTSTAHGFTTGDWIYLDYTSGTATDAWKEVTVTTANAFTVSGTASATSGNVTIYPPIVITVTSHGQSTAASVWIDFSATFTDQAYTVRQAATSTFQCVPNPTTTQGTTGANTSGSVTLTQVGASQTWTRPTGCRTIIVELVGGGGSNTGKGEGQSAGYSRELIDVSATSSVTVTVGGAGVPNTNLTTGGTTSFGAYLSATGGGISAIGEGSGGDVNLRGQPSFINSNTYTGSTPLGYGAIVNASTPALVSDGSGYGFGGFSNNANNIIAVAGSGVVIVTEFY